MIKYRSLRAIVAGCAIAALAGCRTAPPPMVVPASFTPLGVNAPYLMGDVIGGLKARQAKMRAARIRPLGPAEAGASLADLDSFEFPRPSPSMPAARRSNLPPMRRCSRSPER